jgi:hypothetical protein
VTSKKVYVAFTTSIILRSSSIQHGLMSRGYHMSVQHLDKVKKLSFYYLAEK